jgi:integral membrane protein (TIGR01906 family)
VKKSVVVLLALTIPLVLILNGFRIAASDWYVRFEYGRLDLPAQNLPLALTGLHSIQPGGEGIAQLRRAELPPGLPPFQERELRHMQDVRTQLGRLYLAHLVAAALVALGALLLGRRILNALRAGALVTLGIAAVVGAYVLIGFDSFFTGFHRIFFEGDSWQFAETDTLIRLYPEAFWRDTAIFLAALTVGQALVIFGASWLALRLRRGDSERTRPG